MEILVGKNAGFCFGVSNAVTKAEEELNIHPNMDCLGELVHNKQVIARLENKGLRTIEDLSQAGSRVIIRAHGIAKEVYESAEEQGIQLVDLTCPKVLQTHDIIKEYSSRNYHILYLGVARHPEVVGAISFADSFSLIQDLEDIDPVIDKIKKEHITNLLLLAQTTFRVQLFNEIVSILEKALPDNYNLVIKNTICNATQARQQETEELSKQVDFMIIIGGKNSSNTKKLYDIASSHSPAILVENQEDLPTDEIKSYNKIGIMAGASTPKESIEAIVQKLKHTELSTIV